MTEKKKNADLRVPIGEVEQMTSLKGLRFDPKLFKGIPEAIEFEFNKAGFGKAYDNDGKVDDTKNGVIKLPSQDRNLIGAFKNMAGASMASEMVESIVSSMTPLTVMLRQQDVIDKLHKDIAQIDTVKTPYLHLENIEIEIVPKWVQKSYKDKTGEIKENNGYSGLEVNLINYETLTAHEESILQQVLNEIGD